MRVVEEKYLKASSRPSLSRPGGLSTLSLVVYIVISNFVMHHKFATNHVKKNGLVYSSEDALAETRVQKPKCSLK